MNRIICLLICLFVGSANAALVSDFTGGYDVSNWTTSLDGGVVDTTGAPASVLSISSNDGSGPDFTDFTIAALGTGIVSFDWSYSTVDWCLSCDTFGYLLNGIYTQLSFANPSSGTASFGVTTGDIFGFRSYASDSIYGSSTTLISNFSAPGASSSVSAPGSFAIFGLGIAGIGCLRRKKKSAK